MQQSYSWPGEKQLDPSSASQVRVASGAVPADTMVKAVGPAGECSRRRCRWSNDHKEHTSGRRERHWPAVVVVALGAGPAEVCSRRHRWWCNDHKEHTSGRRDRHWPTVGG